MKRRRGRPSKLPRSSVLYAVGPDGDTIQFYEPNSYEGYAARYRTLLRYIDDRPKTFRRRRAQDGRREARPDYIERLIPAVQALGEELWPSLLSPAAARLILEMSTPPATSPRGVNKVTLALLIVLYYDFPQRHTVKQIRDRIKKGGRGPRPLTSEEWERLYRTYPDPALIAEALANSPEE